MTTIKNKTPSQWVTEVLPWPGGARGNRYRDLIKVPTTRASADTVSGAGA